MIDVGDKPVTRRVAIARGFLSNMQRETLERAIAGTVPKGQVLPVARLAGVLAAKRCDEIIPLCHTLPLDQVTVRFLPLYDEGALAIEARVVCQGRTGVEMEALLAVSAAALSVYDLCKALDKSMVVGDLHLWRKTGGRSGDFVHPDPPGPELPVADDPAWLD